MKNIFASSVILLCCSFIFCQEKLNIILISIDTWRYDYISFLSSEKVKTPNIDNFSKNSVFFKYAFTTCPTTAPAHASVLTGFYPKDHKIRENLSGKLNPNLELISEVLKKEGFKTYAFVSSATLSRDYGFSKGFDYYDDNFSPCTPWNKCFVGMRKGEETIKIAKEKVNWEERFFLFLHIFEPHFPYEPPEPYKTKYKDNLYAGEVEYSDYLIGEFLNFIKNKGLFKNTIICIISDHGEGLKEHKESTHGYLLYNSTLRVPLILYYPNCKPQVINYPVSLIDLYVTFLNLLKIKINNNLPGKDLLKQKEREIFFEALYPFFYFGTNKLYGAIKSPYKFIYKKKSEIYNLFEDPKEEKKLGNRELLKKLTKILKENYVNLDKDFQKEMAEESRNLKSLGYMGGADLKKIEGRDPDEVMLIINNLEEARAEYLKGNYKEAMDLYKNLLREFPRSSVIWGEVALVYLSIGKKEEARKSFEEAIKIFPRNFDALVKLANFFSQEGRLREAVIYYERAMALKPNDPDLLFNYAATCANLGDIKKAKSLFEKYINKYPDDPEREKIEEFLKKN